MLAAPAVRAADWSRSRGGNAAGVADGRELPTVIDPSLLYRGLLLLYTIKDGGILTVFDAAGGAVRHQGRVPGAIDKYYASPVAGDGKVYLASEAGKLSVIAAESDWDSVAVADFGEPIYAAPAIVDGVLYVRTATALMGFAKGE